MNHGSFAGISHSADFQLRDLGIFDGETDLWRRLTFAVPVGIGMCQVTDKYICFSNDTDLYCKNTHGFEVL